MINYLRIGQIFFAISFIAIAIQGMIMHDFSFGRPPAWPEGSLRTVWSIIGGVIVIGACAAILVRRKPYEATLLTGFIILSSIFLARNVPDLLSKDLVSAFWSLNAFKTLALAGGACIVAVSFCDPGELSRQQRGILWFGIGAVAYFFFVCGLSHFKYVDFIRGGFIPAYIPFQTFWTYLTGTCLLLASIGVLISRVQKLAAIMAGFMILGWFFLLHIPRTVAAPSDFMEWFGVFESFGFSGICFTMAGVFRQRER